MTSSGLRTMGSVWGRNAKTKEIRRRRDLLRLRSLSHGKHGNLWGLRREDLYSNKLGEFVSADAPEEIQIRLAGNGIP